MKKIEIVMTTAAAQPAAQIITNQLVTVVLSNCLDCPFY